MWPCHGAQDPGCPGGSTSSWTTGILLSSPFQFWPKGPLGLANKGSFQALPEPGLGRGTGGLLPSTQTQAWCLASQGDLPATQAPFVCSLAHPADSYQGCSCQTPQTAHSFPGAALVPQAKRPSLGLSPPSISATLPVPAELGTPSFLPQRSLHCVLPHRSQGALPSSWPEEYLVTPGALLV